MNRKALFITGLGLALIAVSVRQRHALAQDDGGGGGDGSDTAPIACPTGITPTGFFQGIYFTSVRMARSSTTGANNIANYDNLDLVVVSDDKKWAWHDGGGTFSCSRQELPFGLYIDYETIIPPSWGVMLPAPPTKRDGGSPPAGGTGGDDYIVSDDTSDGSEGQTVYCEVTDWYENGVYTDTEIDYCWVE